MDLDSNEALMAPFVSVGTTLPRIMSMHEDYYEETYEGVPQGGPLSPLLGNVLLNELDRQLESRGHKFVRYADDMVRPLRMVIWKQWIACIFLVLNLVKLAEVALPRLTVNTVMSFSAGPN